MLTYHPSMDPYHCLYRIVYFLKRAEETSFEVEKIRIIDFFISFPSALKSFKFPRELMGKRKTFTKKENGYNSILNPKSLFFEMRDIHESAFEILVNVGLIDREEYKHGKVHLIRENLTGHLSDMIEKESSIDSDIGEFAVNELSKLPLLGQNGLKDRSGLMDHRYDLV